MAIQKLSEFAEIGDKNLTGIDMQQGFIQAEKPARQWFNSLFNSTIKKVNEVITAIEAISIGTDKIADGAVTTAKLANVSVTGDKIAKNAALNTPLLPNTYALTTLAAPNLTMDDTGALTRSTYSFGTAAIKNVGTAVGNLVERGADGYPVNNNAVGISQSWQDMAASRATATSYLNSTGRTIAIVILGASAENKIQASSNGSIWIDVGVIGKSGSANAGGSALIPSGHYYRLINGIFSTWSELR